MIPVCRPLLAGYERIIPYLKRIDANQIYANDGPLLIEFEKRLCSHFNLNSGELLCVVNGTIALQVALLALTQDQNNSFCLMPSWTFTATPAAAISAGLTPYFLDVDKKTWALTPEIVEEALQYISEPVGCVVPVSPFGSPIPIKEWDQFTERTGIPVLVDGAGMFVEIEFANTPVVVSMHTTKCFGMGEGGFIASKNQGLMDEIARRRNFGMLSDRLSHYIGINAKVSEYAAAVGLAQLDVWSEKYKILSKKARFYKEKLANLEGVRLLPGYGETWFGGNIVIEFDAPIAAEACEFLSQNGIETKSWWRQGCHLQEAYSHLQSTSLPNTEMLAQSTLGLPFSVGLSEKEIIYVCEKLGSFLHLYSFFSETYASRVNMPLPYSDLQQGSENSFQEAVE